MAITSRRLLMHDHFLGLIVHLFTMFLYILRLEAQIFLDYIFNYSFSLGLQRDEI
jgi:hypothetical protein